MVIRCPDCASDRVVPLTVPEPFGEMLAETPDRPLAQCMACSCRLRAKDIAAQEERAAPSAAL